jgi:hypothetical protein
MPESECRKIRFCVSLHSSYSTTFFLLYEKTVSLSLSLLIYCSEHGTLLTTCFVFVSCLSYSSTVKMEASFPESVDFSTYYALSNSGR